MQEGHWEDVCGDSFLRKLLSMPVEETRWNFYGGREGMGRDMGGTAGTAGTGRVGARGGSGAGRAAAAAAPVVRVLACAQPWQAAAATLRALLPWMSAGRESMYAKSSPLGVDPRQIAQAREGGTRTAEPRSPTRCPCRCAVGSAACGASPASLSRSLGVRPGLLRAPPSPRPFLPFLFLGCSLPLWGLQRIMEIRAQIAREWIQELQLVSEENALLIRETVASAFAQSGSIPVVTDFSKVGAACTAPGLHVKVSCEPAPGERGSCRAVPLQRHAPASSPPWTGASFALKAPGCMPNAAPACQPCAGTLPPHPACAQLGVTVHPELIHPDFVNSNVDDSAAGSDD